MRIFAHRGFSGLYPENTMLSFSKALEFGVDGIELDVHLSKDGEVMVNHDEYLKRTTGKSGMILDYTRSELEKITVNGVEGATIPSLEEYFDGIGRYTITNIELKTAPLYYPDIEEKTYNLIKRFSLEDRVIISSFNWLSVLNMKRIAPELEYALLFTEMKLCNQGILFDAMGIKYYHVDKDLLDQTLVDDMHRSHVMINAWTVNEEDDIKRAIELGIDGIITNFPDRVRRIADVCRTD